MDVQTIIASLATILATLASVIALYFSFFQFVARRRAEKKYVALLSRQKKRLMETLMEQDSDGSLSQINTEELRRLTEIFRELAKSLPKEDKVLIDNSLLQNSEIGRLRYVRKLLEESGVFVEQQPLTKP